ncbi:MAG: helix-turn-helix transcriptional regulator [Deltaproteobacteria bacterium]|nr:helix-turn-helix transcriptional regulator [Deltaproteobacteria bacterium]
MQAAEDLAAIGRLALEGLRRQLPALGAFTFFPLRPGLQDASAVLQWSRSTPTDVLLSRFLRVAPRLQQDLGPLPGMLGTTRTHDLARRFPRGVLERTRFYTEFARPCRIERQILGFCIGDGRLGGFLCVARGARARPFSEHEVARVEEVRAEVERALVRLQRTGRSLDGPPGLLAALEQGLPLSCALFDLRGSLLWASRAAADRLQAEAVRLGPAYIVWDGTPRFAAWRRAALAVLDSTHAPSGPRAVYAGPQPATVRCLELPTGDRLALVIDEESTEARGSPEHTSELKRHGLTSREADVAELAARGYSVLNLSSRLAVAECTIRSHLKQIYRKLGVASRAELAARLFAARAGDPVPGPEETVGFAGPDGA